MKKYLVACLFFILFMFVVAGIPCQVFQVDLSQSVYAMGSNGGHHGNGHGNSQGNNGNGHANANSHSHGVPDPGTILAFLGIGGAAVGAVVIFRGRKRK